MLECNVIIYHNITHTPLSAPFTYTHKNYVTTTYTFLGIILVVGSAHKTLTHMTLKSNNIYANWKFKKFYRPKCTETL